jgi:hypothetical protein
MRRNKRMKLNSVVDCVGIDRDIKIMEGKECKYFGNALNFYGQKFPKFFKSRSVLRLDAECNILVITISEAPTFAGKEKQ